MNTLPILSLLPYFVLYYSVDDICWSTDLKPITLHAFTENPGLRVPLSTSPLQVFSLFFTSLLHFVVLQTNQYALECMGGERYAQWTHVTRIYGFYDSDGHCPFTHFGWLLEERQNLPLLPGNIEDILRSIFLNSFDIYIVLITAPSPLQVTTSWGNPTSIGLITWSIQISMLPTKKCKCGWSHAKGFTLKQYLPLTPLKYGIKVWALSDDHNGYLSEFEVYTSKRGNAVEKDLGANVVKRLTPLFINTYRHIYFDNYFSSLLDLLKSGLYGYGTIPTNRKGFPDPIKILAKKAWEREEKEDVPIRTTHCHSVARQQTGASCSH